MTRLLDDPRVQHLVGEAERSALPIELDRAAAERVVVAVLRAAASLDEGPPSVELDTREYVRCMLERARKEGG